MGKAGNTKRKSAKQKHEETREAELASLQDNIAGGAYQTALEGIYGRKGVPDSNPVLDLLGRKIDPDAIPPAIAKPTLMLPPPAKRDRRVTLMRDHTLKYPDLYLEVFIVGDRYEEAAFAPMFARSRCQRAKSVMSADIVVFTGGEDVDPALYGEERYSNTRFNSDRDSADIEVYLQCLEEGIPMFGVCRGAQFLHVMQGGKLYQDVDGHYGNHSMYDIRSGETIQQVSSVHHQMVIQNVVGGMEIIGTSNKATTRHKNPSEKDVGNNADIEAFFYRSVCAFGVQGHPEYSGYNHFTIWTLNMLNDLINMNPDLTWVNKSLRIKPEIMAERDAYIKGPAPESIEVSEVEVN